MPYSRANPSPRFKQLAALYARMHLEGETRLGIPASETFPGASLLPHVARVKRLIDATQAKTILDYGAGKGMQYRPQRIVIEGSHVADGIAEYWDAEVTCYDPGYAPFSALPQSRFDGVVCTDVLEHCAEEDLPWILDELFGFAHKFVYLNVACFPARKSLPNGENAHVTVRPPEWWAGLVGARPAARSGIRWQLLAAHRAETGAVVETAFDSRSTQATLSEVSVEGRTARFVTPNEITRWRAQTLYTKEPVTIEWLRSIPQGAVLADVGANVGMYTVFAALGRGARVIAFEPEAENYALLNQNIRLNALQDRALAVCAGLSDRHGIERLFLSHAGPGGSCHSLGQEVGFDLKPRAAAFAQGCIALRFDDLLDKGQVPAPEYVKIDVDGFEHEVLRGMEAMLRRGNVRSLLVELNPALPEHIEARKFLEDLGFAWDATQVASAARASGPFTGVAEHVFKR